MSCPKTAQKSGQVERAKRCQKIAKISGHFEYAKWCQKFAFILPLQIC